MGYVLTDPVSIIVDDGFIFSRFSWRKAGILDMGIQRKITSF
jgi:hypothetical protein